MKFKRKIAKLEDVPEAYRGQYQAEGEAFTLKDEFEIATAAEVDVTGLTNNRDTLLRENKALKEKFGDLDPAAARAAIAEVERLKGTQKTEGDRLARIEQELEAEKGRRTEADLRANKQLIKAEGQAAIIAAKGNPVLLMPFVEQRSAVIEGTLTVLQEDGKTPALDKDGRPQTLAGLISDFKSRQEYAGAFAASEAGGSGAPVGGSAPKLPPGYVASTDAAGMGANLEKIASGEVTVQGPTPA